MDRKIEEIRKRVERRRLFYDTLNMTLRQSTDDIIYLLNQLDESRRKEGAAVEDMVHQQSCKTCKNNDVFWKGAGCNAKANFEPCKWEPRGPVNEKRGNDGE